MTLIRPGARGGAAIALAAWSIANLGLADPGPPSTPPPHVLVTAAETLYQRKLPEACDLVLRLGLEAEDLTRADRVRLQLLTATRRIDSGDEDAAKKAIRAALELDRDAKPPPFATDRARLLLEDARALLPPPPQQAPPQPAVNREPAARPLFRAMDGLYQEMQLEAADVMLDLASSRPELSKEERAQVLLRKGILRMETDEEERARASFLGGLELDRRAKLPAYAPPKTLHAFEAVRATLPPERASPASIQPAVAKELPARAPMVPPAAGMIICGGTGFVAGTAIFIGSVASSDKTGLGIGPVIALTGAALLTGGVVWHLRSEPLAIRVNVAPTEQGGLVLATGRF